ncbi:MAG: hypothetical protein ACEQSX_08110, partial [Baekduiaceae bacterium]
MVDDEARITGIRLWFRPLPGLTALMRSVGPKLARETSLPRAAIVAGMTGPLVGVTFISAVRTYGEASGLNGTTGAAGG